MSGQDEQGEALSEACLPLTEKSCSKAG